MPAATGALDQWTSGHEIRKHPRNPRQWRSKAAAQQVLSSSSAREMTWALLMTTLVAAALRARSTDEGEFERVDVARLATMTHGTGDSDEGKVLKACTRWFGVWGRRSRRKCCKLEPK